MKHHSRNADSRSPAEGWRGHGANISQLVPCGWHSHCDTWFRPGSLIVPTLGGAGRELAQSEAESPGCTLELLYSHLAAWRRGSCQHQERLWEGLANGGPVLTRTLREGGDTPLSPARPRRVVRSLLGAMCCLEGERGLASRRPPGGGRPGGHAACCPHPWAVRPSTADTPLVPRAPRGALPGPAQCEGLALGVQSNRFGPVGGRPRAGLEHPTGQCCDSHCPSRRSFCHEM